MATKSIGSAGRDYASIGAWVTYLQGLGTINTTEIGEMYNDSEFTSASQIVIGGYTIGSGTVTLRCAAGQSFKDHTSKLTNALRYNQANGVGLKFSMATSECLRITGASFTLDGLQITNTTGSAGAILSLFGGPAQIVQNCILQTKDVFSNSYGVVAFALADTTSEIRNSVIILGGTVGYGLDASAGVFTDLTIVATGGAGGTGFNGSSGNSLLKNVAVAGFTTDYAGTANASSANNATDKGSFGGTNFGGSGQVSVVGSTEFESVTASSEDLRLKSTSVKLKNNGATVGPSTDIVGTTRPQGAAYDIGCWELASSVKLRRYSALSGLGASGPFFNDIL